MSEGQQRLPVTAIIDIGKTNKKFFLFDEAFQVVYEVSKNFDELQDEDGFPCDDVQGFTAWMKETFAAAFQHPDFDIKRLNFSAYGASLVHLDAQGQRVGTFYNYLKDFPKTLRDRFFQQVGGQAAFELETASPYLGMLNSGLQLYWLKYKRPKAFATLKHSLHLPQYCSWVFTGKLFSDYTSVGCHTGLWDVEAHQYHRWVTEEGLTDYFPPMVSAGYRTDILYQGKKLSVGPGIHDSSSALIPYLQKKNGVFVVISTGTWSISLNPFNTSPLTLHELERDCLHYLGIRGDKVKSSRLFLGEEYKLQLQRLEQQYHQQQIDHRTMQFSEAIYQKVQARDQHVFPKYYLNYNLFALKKPDSLDFTQFDSFAEAYHQLVYELVEFQVASLQLILGDNSVERIFVEGGFGRNDVFMQFLRNRLPNFDVRVCDFPQGSALGAAKLIQAAGS